MMSFVKINPCVECKTVDNVKTVKNRTSQHVTGCTTCFRSGKPDIDGLTSIDNWNDVNPKPDPLAIAHEQLAECYELLAGIVARHVAGNDIVILANDLLAKHRSKNNESM